MRHAHTYALVRALKTIFVPPPARPMPPLAMKCACVRLYAHLPTHHLHLHHNQSVTTAADTTATTTTTDKVCKNQNKTITMMMIVIIVIVDDDDAQYPESCWERP